MVLYPGQNYKFGFHSELQAILNIPQKTAKSHGTKPKF
jgi:hypothetical protein